MHFFEISDASQKNPPLHIEVADSFWSRFRGLMMRKELPKDRGLYITPCNSIHMCFMRFAIDAVYVDKEGRIRKLVEGLKPWIGLSICVGAHGVLELPAGTIRAYGWKQGEIILGR